MYKAENDRRTGRIDTAVTAVLETNSNAYENVLTINTDATVGTLTISVKSRLADDLAPAVREDGVTPTVIDLATSERTLKSPFPIKELQAVPAGLNGTFYELTNSGAGNFE